MENSVGGIRRKDRVMTERLNQSSGVNYITLDRAKRLGQRIAATTSGFLPPGYKDAVWTRGESVQLVDAGSFFIAGLIEGLGTENLVADAVDADRSGHPRSYYYNIGISNVAVVLNDAATLGVQPLQYFLKVDVCEEEWLTNRRRISALYKGVAEGCRQSRCTYHGGEMPSLKDMVVPRTAILCGSMTGIVRPKRRVIEPRIRVGDRIILVASSSVHDNGITKCRKIARKLPRKYQTKVPGTKLTFGEALLPATYLYVRMMQALIDAGLIPHYAINITGHGLRKIMRADEEFGYVLKRVLPAHPVFGFIQEHGNLSNSEMCGSYNLGQGFGVIVAKEKSAASLRVIRRFFPAIDAGEVVPAKSGKWMHIEPYDVGYGKTDLQVR